MEGAGLLSIDSEGLTEAATSYGKAADSYSSTVTDIEKKLNAALEVWDDASKDTWTTKVTEAITRMKKVGDRMNSNAAVLSAIATAASETERNVSSGISSL